MCMEVRHTHRQLTVRQCQNWFAKFRSGNFDVEDAPRSGSPVEADKDAINALLDANRRITTREIGLRLNLSNSMVYDHLKAWDYPRILMYGFPMFSQREICVAAMTSKIRFSNVTKMIRF
ncbi:histone-lysine N-methyltransferase SETMAR [Trichonephila clavipes]|nr:histone-lysine N-methyltransferase SETMAR [Trichonephila clavipes]